MSVWCYPDLRLCGPISAKKKSIMIATEKRDSASAADAFVGCIILSPPQKSSKKEGASAPPPLIDRPFPIIIAYSHARKKEAKENRE